MGFRGWGSRQGAGRGELKVWWSLIWLSEKKYKMAGLLEINKGKKTKPSTEARADKGELSAIELLVEVKRFLSHSAVRLWDHFAVRVVGIKKGFGLKLPCMCLWK